MLRFFRINDPYRLAIIFILMIAIRSIQGFFIQDVSYYELKWLLLGEWLNKGFHMYSETFDYTGPIATFIYKYLNLIFGRSAFIHYGFSTVVIIFQAGIFNQLLLKNKAYDENSYLPAFLYMILMVSVPDFMTLSPQLLSLTFILLALRNVLRRIDNQVTDELFLNSGIFVGVAAMIYLPAAVFFLVFLFALILFSTAVTRRLILYLFSFLLIFALCSLYFYWRGDFQVFFDSYIVQNLLMLKASSLTIMEVVSVCSGFLFIFLISIFKTWGSARLTNLQQKIQQVIWLMFFGGLATFFLSNEKSLHELVFIVPVIAFFWTYYFVLIRRRIAKVIMPALMIFGLLLYSGYSYREYLSPLAISETNDAKDGTMILGENLNYYTEHEMLTPCFEDHLTSRAFNGLDYYGSAGELYTIFEKADPNYIVDHNNIADKIFSRFPVLSDTYRKIGPDEYEKISN